MTTNEEMLRSITGNIKIYKTVLCTNVENQQEIITSMNKSMDRCMRLLGTIKNMEDHVIFKSQPHDGYEYTDYCGVVRITISNSENKIRCMVQLSSGVYEQLIEDIEVTTDRSISPADLKAMQIQKLFEMSVDELMQRIVIHIHKVITDMNDHMIWLNTDIMEN